MFQRHESDVVGFNSSWDVSREQCDGFAQTVENLTEDKATSSNSYRNVQIHTDFENLQKKTVPENEIVECLRRTVPIMLDEIQKYDNEIDHTFHEYDNTDVDRRSKINLQQVLKTGNAKNDNANKTENIPIVGLSLSSVGNTLAAGTGYLYHDDWCEHECSIYIYSKRARSEDYELIHDIKTSSCVSTISFHPEEPALLAVTSYIGEVFIWNLQKNTNHDSPTISNTDAHSSRTIPSVLWLNREQIGHYFDKPLMQNSEKILITGGSDGRIQVWKIDLTSNTMNVHMSFDIKVNKTGMNQRADISCFDFQYIWKEKFPKETSEVNNREYADDYFIVGTKTGEILLCRMKGSKNLSSQNDACIVCLTSHNASVLFLKFCQIKPLLLLSTGADQEIRIYNILQDLPIQVILLENKISSAGWLSNSEHFVLVSFVKAIKGSKTLHFQAINTTTKSCEVIDSKDCEWSDESFTTVLEAHNDGRRIACGDTRGQIKILGMQLGFDLGI